MIPQRVPTRPELQANPCWYVRWGIAPELAYRLSIMADQADPLPLNIISGFRTQADQVALATAGRPAAADALSTHRTCPATGADLSLPTVDSSTRATRAMFGRWAVYSGLRWGGGSSVNDAGIPTDWNHVDLGPRHDQVAETYRRGLTPS